MPIVAGGRLLAVLVVSNEDSGTPITDGGIRSLDLLAREVALVIENRELADQVEETRRQARTDELTGLSNRRHCQAVLAREIEAARERDRPLVLALFDLDHFKAYNDRFGHATGDRILEQVGRIMQACSRHEDTCGHLGGDKFLLVLPGADRAAAESVCERAREQVAALAARMAGSGAPGALSLSAGVALLEPGDDPAALLERADQALYRAKEAGRDRVC